MPEGHSSSARGVHRHRAVFVSSEGGLSRCLDPDAAGEAAGVQLRRVAREGRAVSFVIADCRLLEPGNPVAGLLPRSLRERIRPAAADGPRQAVVSPRMERLRRLSPWIGAIVTAATGFLIFCLRAA